MFEGLAAKLIAGAAAIVGIGLATHVVDAKFYHGKLAELEAAFSARIIKSEQDKDAAEKRYLDLSVKAKEEGDAKQAEIDELSKTANDAQGKLAAAQARVAALAADNGKLRGDLAAYARGPADDTAAACEDRAGVLAGLLAEGDEVVARLSGRLAEGGRLATESASAAETYGNSVNTCVMAWPH